jgi:chorismate dehydratase
MQYELVDARQRNVDMVRFAVLPYCNAAPLVTFIRDFCPTAVEVVRLPMEMLCELKAGRADVALLPVADFLSEPGLRMIPGLGICADGPVESVLLQTRCPLEEVQVIRFSPESRTSNSLIRVLLDPPDGAAREIHFTHEEGTADAEVVIGDKALCMRRMDYCYDLSEMWNQQTGLPFVFAVWAYRAGLRHVPAIRSILHQTKDKKLTNIPSLAGLHAGRLGQDPAYLEHYLTDCLYYDVGPREMAGMRRFHEMIAARDTDASDAPVTHLTEAGG